MSALRRSLSVEVRRFLKHPLLSLLRQARLSPDQFRSFSIQRHLAASIFVPLLVAARTLASKTYNAKLAEVLEDNWRDETGNQPNAVGYGAQPHSVWRDDYLQALSINPFKLPLPYCGVKRYEQMLATTMVSGDYLQTAGAMLFLEASISPEYAIVRKCRDRLFPQAFVVLPTDSATVREHKTKAALYLNDHEVHDRERHLPDLYGALVGYELEQELLGRIVRGVQTAAQAKIELYNGLHQAVLSTPLTLKR